MEGEAAVENPGWHFLPPRTGTKEAVAGPCEVSLISVPLWLGLDILVFESTLAKKKVRTQVTSTI